MTPLPASPFIDPALIEPQPFVFDEARKRAFWKQIAGDRPFPEDDPSPIFLTDPSADYIAAIRRELAPFTEAAARK
jgi:hypothetical protein